MPASDLQLITLIGVKRKPRRILSIVSNTAQLKGPPVGFFGEEMTRAFPPYAGKDIAKNLSLFS